MKNKPNGGGLIIQKFVTPGTYILTLAGMPQGQPFPADACSGMASVTVEIVDPNVIKAAPLTVKPETRPTIVPPVITVPPPVKPR